MDSKELKNYLKNARDAIGRKDFKEALRHCKVWFYVIGASALLMVILALGEIFGIVFYHLFQQPHLM